MEEIETKLRFVSWSFFRLLNATPAEDVHPSVVMIAAGACHGLIYGPMGGRLSELEDAFTKLWNRDQPYECGRGLLTLTKTLFERATQRPMERIDLDDLSGLMVAAFNDPGLRIKGDGTNLRIVSSRRFRRDHHVRINVILGPSA
jgi:hypothetical protein